ncbi:uncharacterized protein LOC143856939 [Tasmannia lanceolata]|uniref:uncharacterized protein LOC143856939 n=1 Tax=Tasmannia lanceolata TaxID=3420 RepID=UPI00406300DD
MSTDPKKRSTGSFCDFNRDHGHETNHCFHLRLQLERLAEEGHLDQYLRSPARIGRSHEALHLSHKDRSRGRHRSCSRHRSRRRHRSRSRPHFRSHSHRSRRNQSPKEVRPPRQPPAPEQPPAIVGKINIITEGPAARGPTTARRRAYAERVFSMEMPSKKVRKDLPQEGQIISFSSEDYEGLQVPHYDALVIRLIIANFDVGKILVDTRSSVNVLHLETFEEMRLREERLGPAEYSIYGFSGACRGRPCKSVRIIGLPALRDLGVVVSTPHLKMKFPTRTGTGEVRGQQMVARQCYAASLKGSNAPAENFAIGSENPRERALTVRGEPIEELDSISIAEDQPEREV